MDPGTALTRPWAQGLGRGWGALPGDGAYPVMEILPRDAGGTWPWWIVPTRRWTYPAMKLARGWEAALPGDELFTCPAMEPRYPGMVIPLTR